MSIRLRLTLLFASLFLLSGAALLALTYALISNRTQGTLFLTVLPTNGAPPTPDEVIQRHIDAMHQFLREGCVALGLMTVVAGALGWFMAGRALRPVRTITVTTRQISASNLHHRLALTGPADELKHLGDTIDGLLARLEGSFTAQRQFVANASHELRTPLTRQRTLLEVALGDPDADAETLRDACERVLTACEHQERLIEGLFTLAQGERGLDHREPVDLRAVTDEVVMSRGPEAERRGLTVTTRLDAARVEGDPRLLERLVSNLVDNAQRHNVTGGCVEVSTGGSTLSVVNTGPVVPAEHLGRLFRPFERLGSGRTVQVSPGAAARARDRAASGGTASAEGFGSTASAEGFGSTARAEGFGSTARADGLGLGLSIVLAIASAHGATLHAHAPAEPAGGLNIRIDFPPPRYPVPESNRSSPE